MPKVKITEERNINKQVDFKGNFYTSNYLDWIMINDIMRGERAIKSSGTKYVPLLSNQSVSEYIAYVNRGSFYNAFARTVQGLVGAITRKPASLSFPSQMEYLKDSFTQSKVSFDQILKLVTGEILSQGYCGILVDLDESGKPYGALYHSMDIFNYRTGVIQEQLKLTLLVLRENVEEFEATDGFVTVNAEQIRVLYLDEEGYLVVNLYRRAAKNSKTNWLQIPIKGEYDFQPRILGGNRLDYIPFVFFGGNESNFEPQKPPLLDLAYLNIKHWQVSVDYYHGLHFCGLPTPWAAGFNAEEERVLTIGSGTAWISNNSEARCGYLEFSGQGLSAIEKALDKLERQMAVVGSRILEEQKKGVETAEAMLIRSSGDISNLASISLGIENNFLNVFRYMANWMRIDSEKIELSLSKDFIAAEMNPSMITALLQALQANKISQDTFLYSLMEGEILPPGVTIEDEKAKIEFEKEANPYSPAVEEESEEEK